MDETYSGNAAELRRPAEVLPPGMRVTLSCMKGSAQGQHFRVSRTITVIGRKTGDIVIPDPTLSGRHAEIEVADRNVFISDLKSTNGVKINGVKVERQALKNLDSLKLGDLEFNVNIVEDRYLTEAPSSDPGLGPDEDGFKALIAAEETTGTRRLRALKPVHPVPLKDKNLYLGVVIQGEKKVIKVETASTVLGSQSDADVRIEDDSVSGRHLQIEAFEDGRIRVKDLASTNGTYLNNQRVPLSVEFVSDGDWLRLGESLVKIILRPLAPPA